MTKLGQHFLKNKIKLKKIVNSLELKDDDVVIEIGPGHGELTGELRSANYKLKIIAIEKDKELAESLKEKFKNDENIEIIEGDALKLLTQLTNDLRPTTNNYKITGNIPYYITGFLFRIFSELKNKPSLIILLIQKEVAERICAEPKKMNPVRSRTLKMSDGRFQQPASNGMNLLAAAVQFWAKPKIIGYISKKDFRPMPKVDSAIIKLTIYDRQPATNDAENYYQFIKILFKQPRKTILNNLRLTTDDQRLLKEKIESMGINFNNRPQNLNINQIIKLSQIL